MIFLQKLQQSNMIQTDRQISHCYTMRMVKNIYLSTKGLKVGDVVVSGEEGIVVSNQRTRTNSEGTVIHNIELNSRRPNCSFAGASAGLGSKAIIHVQ